MASYRRIYDTAVKKFLLGTGIPLGIGFIWLLVTLGAITITGASGDMVCRGDELEPCVAEINFTANTDVFLYINDTTWITNGSLADLKVYRKWGKGWREIPFSTGCTGSWCGCYWCGKNVTATYSYVFRAGKDYTLRFEAYKKKKDDVIKWGFGDWKTWEPVDPIWLADEKERYLKLLESNVELTYAEDIWEICNPALFKYLNGIDVTYGGEKEYVRYHEFYREETYQVPIEQPVTEERKECRKPYPNETLKEDVCWNKTIIVDWTTIGYDTRTRWVPWDGTVKPALTEKPTCMKVKLRVKLNPKLGERNIYIMPSAFGYDYPEYSWWNTSFDKCQDLRINTTNSTNGFQAKISVSYDSDMNSDFSDIRFTNTSCTYTGDATEAYAWNESQTDGTLLVVWLNTSTWGANHTYAMYYDNQTQVSATWDGNKTAEWFDSFDAYNNNSDVIGQGGWEDRSSGANMFYVRDDWGQKHEGNLILNSSDINTNHQINHSLPLLTSGSLIVHEAYQGTDYYFNIVGADSAHNGIWYTRTIFSGANNYMGVQMDSSTQLVKTRNNTLYKWNFTWNETHKTTICVSNTTMVTCKYDTNVGSGNNPPYTIILINVDGATTGNMRWDSMALMNMTKARQNIQYTFGSEESASAAVTSKNITGDIEYGTVLKFNTTSGCITDLYRTNCTTNPKLDIAVYPAIYTFDSGSTRNITGKYREDDLEDSSACVGVFDNSSLCANATDEDMTTYAERDETGTSYVIENYTNEFDAGGANMSFKYGQYNSSNFTYSFWNFSSGGYGWGSETNTTSAGDGANHTIAEIPSDCIGDYVSVRVHVHKTDYVNSTYYEGNITWIKNIANGTAAFTFNSPYIDVLDTMFNMTYYSSSQYPRDIKIDILNDGRYDAEFEGELYKTGRMFLNETNESNHPFNITNGFGVFYIKLSPLANLIIANITIGNNTPTATPTINEEEAWVYTGSMFDPQQCVDEDFTTHCRPNSNDVTVYENFTIPDTIVADTLATNIKVGGAVGEYASGTKEINITVYWYNWTGTKWDEAFGCYDNTYAAPAGCWGTGGHNYYNESLDTSDYVSNNLFRIKLILDGNDFESRYVNYYESAINYSLTAPVNMEIDSLNDQTNETYVAELNDTTTFELNMSGIQDYIEIQNTSYVYVPISITYEPSQINMTVYNISINYTIYNLTLNTTAISERMSSNQTIAIRIQSENNITLRDLFIPYQGNGNMTVFNFTAGSFSRSENITVDVYWSNFSITLPDYVYYPEFIPKTNSSKNVTPWGQTYNVPMYNITALGYNKSMNLTIYVNESYDDCFNITASTVNTKTGGTNWILNTSTVTFFSNLSRNDNGSIWLWADLDNCPTGTQINFYPEIASCCYTCTQCWEEYALAPAVIRTEFLEGFESTLSPNWTVIGSPGTYNSTQIMTSGCGVTPHAGSNYLMMNATANGHYEVNGIKTIKDLSGVEELTLTFYHRETNEELHPAGDHSGDAPCTSGSCGDGAYFTCDGNYWHLITVLSITNSAWTKYGPYNLHDDADWCGSTNSSFAIKFLQFDNYRCPTDGRAFDSINITYWS